MKRILLLTTVFMMMLGTSFSSAQTDADNFYKSDLVSVEKVSFSNQYKMKVAGNLFLPKNMKESLRNENGRTGVCNTLHRPVFLGWE